MFLKRSKLGFPTYYQTSVLAPTTREGRPYAYHFGIGPWLDSKRTPVAYIHQGVLRFRLHDRFWEERLLTYIYMHAGWQPQQVLRWQIRQLFAELKLPKEPERPWKTKQHFVEAMDRLKTADPKTNTPFIADWKFEEDIYPTGKDWFERWLDSSIVVTLPSSPLAPR